MARARAAKLTPRHTVRYPTSGRFAPAGATVSKSPDPPGVRSARAPEPETGTMPLTRVRARPRKIPAPAPASGAGST